MKLYLVQHGDALDKDFDRDRPLSDQGHADVERLAEVLARAGVRIERVIHSGKLRAQQSAELLAQALTPGVEPETSGLINPNDPPSAFDWQSESWNRDTLVVGHLPFMARLVAQLVTGDEDRPFVAFTPGTAICLEHAEDSWRINWMIRPELLR
jgi:phosphohistidine phosphatase